MPVDSRILRNAQEFLALGLMVVAIGGGWYYVGDEVGDTWDTVEVGWWNIRNLSDRSRDDDEIRLIAASITEPDVLAIGELNDPVALERIAAELGSNWRWAATATKIGRTSDTEEYYGFLWDSDIVRMVGSIHVDSDPGDLLDRQPAWATFQTTNGRLDFTLVGFHATWSDGSLTKIRAEARELDDVWLRTQDSTLDDDDIILVGDFNLNVGDEGFAELLGLAGLIRANEDTGPTNIKSESTYDQIFLSLDQTVEWTGEFDTYPFDEELFDNDDKAANLAVSDHRPVWISLYIPENDDDGPTNVP